MNSRSAFSTKRLRSPAGAAERNATFQYRLLRMLAANPVRTQNELAAELGSHGATVNAHLKILKDQGYIESGETEAPPPAMIGRNNDWRDFNRNKQAKMSEFVGSGRNLCLHKRGTARDNTDLARPNPPPPTRSGGLGLVRCLR